MVGLKLKSRCIGMNTSAQGTDPSAPTQKTDRDHEARMVPQYLARYAAAAMTIEGVKGVKAVRPV